MDLAKKIGNSLLAIALLIATTGITLNKHYCMGRLKSVAVFEHAKNCLGTDEADPMPCCEDVSQELKVNEITQVVFDFDSQPKLYELITIQFMAANITVSSQLEKPKFTDYLPPPPTINFQVDHQVFII